MTRLSNTPSVEGLISQVENAQRQLKQSQRVGASSYSIHTGMTGFQVFNFSSTGSFTVTATFTADHQDNAFCDIGYEVFKNGTDEVNRDKTAFFDVYKQYTSDPRKTVWQIVVWNNFYSSPVTFNVRYFFQSTDSGVMTVV